MKRVLLCISGSIAAYKAADLVSALTKEGIEVQCLLTESARSFVTPLVLETLSGRPVQSRLWGKEISGTEHIRLARWPDLVVFAPATAHLIARLSLGLADDLITTVALATRAPFLIAPAMNTAMWENPRTQRHVTELRDAGARFVAPASGVLACGEEGAGKLASVEEIVAAIRECSDRDDRAALAAKDIRIREPLTPSARLLITAGPTISRIDAVRYITNPSTGKMGLALAQAALESGWSVTLLLGRDKGVAEPTDAMLRHPGFELVRVETAEEMAALALVRLPDCRGVIATAAVLDYRVGSPVLGKKKRGEASLLLELIPSVDVLKTLRAHGHPGQFFFGFAAETDDELENAKAKLAGKNLDLLFVNRVAREDRPASTGFGGDQNAGTLLKRGAEPISFGLTSKLDLARRLLQEVPPP